VGGSAIGRAGLAARTKKTAVRIGAGVASGAAAAARGGLVARTKKTCVEPVRYLGQLYFHRLK
jgi:hypothetical protein